MINTLENTMKNTDKTLDQTNLGYGFAVGSSLQKRL